MNAGISCQLPEELAIRLHQYTEEKGISADDFVRHLLNENLPPLDPAKEKRRREAVIAWLSARDEAKLQNEEEDDGYDILEALERNRQEERDRSPAS